MLNQRLSVAREITLGIVSLEKTLDGAIVEQAKLQIAGIEGRRTAHLPLDAGQTALDKLAEANALMIAARKIVHEAHYALRDVRGELNLPTIAYGDQGDTPAPMAPSGTDSSPALAVVRAA